MGRASVLTVMKNSDIVTMRQRGASLCQISLTVGRSVNAVKLVIDKFSETRFICKRENKKLEERNISN